MLGIFRQRRISLWLSLIFGAWLLVITPSEAEKAPVFSGQIDYGKLTIYSDVLGADIYVDAKFVGQDRATISNIPAGKHYVRVVKEEKNIQTGLVDVREGEETIIVAKQSEEELLSKIRKPNHVVLFGGITNVGYHESNAIINANLAYRPQAGVGTEVKFPIPLIDVEIGLGFIVNYPSVIVTPSGEAQMAISSPYACVAKELLKVGPFKLSVGGGLNYAIFSPGADTQLSIASRLGYIGYLEGIRNIADNQKMIVKTGYVNYNGKSSVNYLGNIYYGDVTCSGYFLQVGMAYQL